MKKIDTNFHVIKLSIQSKLSMETIKLNSTSSIETGKLPSKYKLDEEGFADLWKLHPKEHGTVTLYGKQIEMPRYNKAYGVDYKFSNENHVADPIEHPFLKKLLKYVNKIADDGITYNGILVNWYRNGENYIGPHSDDESSLVDGSSIYSFSFGATRDFVLKHKQNSQRLVFPLKSNTMLVMKGETQRYYKHSVPKRLKVTGKRINVTIRAFE